MQEQHVQDLNKLLQKAEGQQKVELDIVYQNAKKQLSELKKTADGAEKEL